MLTRNRMSLQYSQSRSARAWTRSSVVPPTTAAFRTFDSSSEKFDSITESNRSSRDPK